MNLIDVARQCGDRDLLRQLAETNLAKLKEFEVAERVGAGRHERSDGRDCKRTQPGIPHGPLIIFSKTPLAENAGQSFNTGRPVPCF
jgi:hypothetical protein